MIVPFRVLKNGEPQIIWNITDEDPIEKLFFMGSDEFAAYGDAVAKELVTEYWGESGC